MSDAVFRDDDGRWLWVRYEAKYDLGYEKPGRYIWAQHIGTSKNRQVCEGGHWQGNTLMWPGRVVGYGPEQTNKMGHTFHVPVYEAWEDSDTLCWLGKNLRARTYKSRASYEKYSNYRRVRR